MSDPQKINDWVLNNCGSETRWRWMSTKGTVIIVIHGFYTVSGSETYRLEIGHFLDPDLPDEESYWLFTETPLWFQREFRQLKTQFAGYDLMASEFKQLVDEGRLVAEESN